MSHPKTGGSRIPTPISRMVFKPVVGFVTVLFLMGCGTIPGHASPQSSFGVYRTLLEQHFLNYPPEGDTWNCIQLAHTLDQLYQNLSKNPTIAYLHLLQTKPNDPVIEKTKTALRHCLLSFPKAARIDPLIRHYLAILSLEPSTEPFLEAFLEVFFPVFPKRVPQLKRIQSDLKTLASVTTPTTPKTLQNALAVFGAVFDPDRRINRFGTWFSDYMVLHLKSSIWQLHFRYRSALRSLVSMLDRYYVGKNDFSARLHPFEKKYLDRRQFDFLSSLNNILVRTRWLAKRIGTAEARKTNQKYQKAFLAYRTEAQQSVSRPEKWRIWKRRLDGVRSLWNRDKRAKAILRAKALVADMLVSPSQLRRNKKGRAVLADLQILLGILYDAAGDHEQSLFWLDQAHRLCAGELSSCLITYHRIRIYIHLSHGEFKETLPLLTTMINTHQLESNEKQEYFFWKWLVSKKLGRGFDYSFPFLSIYRHYAACIDPSKREKLLSHIPKMKHILSPPATHFEARWLKRFLSPKKVYFLKDELPKKNTTSATTAIIKEAAQKILNRVTRDRLQMPTDQLLTFVALLQHHNLYAYAISILFQEFKQTPLDQLPLSFFRLYFPLSYTEEISHVAGTLKIPKPLISAIIRRESIFEREATSPAYALGLMQLLPSTAKHLAANHKVPYETIGAETLTLFDPNKNVLLGSLFVRNLMRRFRQDLIRAVASYNAGGSRVVKWQKRFSSIQGFPILFMERIPYRETRGYVKWVSLFMLYYAYLYDPVSAQETERTFCKRVTQIPFLDQENLAAGPK